MSFLTENPNVMLEALAALVQKAGGSVTITVAEMPGPFNLLSKLEPGVGLHLAIEEYQPYRTGTGSA